jgi:hypothetical protein
MGDRSLNVIPPSSHTSQVELGTQKVDDPVSTTTGRVTPPKETSRVYVKPFEDLLSKTETESVPFVPETTELVSLVTRAVLDASARLEVEVEVTTGSVLRRSVGVDWVAEVAGSNEPAV